MQLVHSEHLDRGGDLDVLDVAGCDGHDVARFAVAHYREYRFAVQTHCGADGESCVCFHALPDVVPDEKPEPLLHAPDVVMHYQTAPVHVALCACCYVLSCYDAVISLHVQLFQTDHALVYGLQSMAPDKHCR